MRKTAAFLLFLLVGAVLFFGVVRTVGWQEVQQVMLEFSGFKGSLILLLTFFMLLLGNLRWQEILRYQGYRISFFQLLQSYLGGFALSFFTPMVVFGSEIFRSSTLEERNNIPFSRGIVSTVIERFLESTFYLFVVIFVIALLFVSQHLTFSKLPLILFLVVAILAGALFFFYFKSFKRESILHMFFPHLQKTNNILEIEKELLSFFKWGNRALWEGLMLSFVKGTVALLRSWMLLAFLGKFLGFFPALTITGFTFLSLFIPIPGQLGSHEALQAFVFQALGEKAASGAAFALFIRAADLLLALLGLFFFLRLAMVLVRTAVIKKIEQLFEKAL